MVAPNQNQTIDPTQPPAPGSLEPLSQEESRFLSQFFRDFKEDLFAWSAATDIDLDVLAKWLNHPKIAAYVAALRHHQAQTAKRRCIDLLNTIIDSDEPLPEKRRAATTLLRAIAPAGRASSRRTPHDTNEPAPSHLRTRSGQHQQANHTHTTVQAASTTAHADAHAGTHQTSGTHHHHEPAPGASSTG